MYPKYTVNTEDIVYNGSIREEEDSRSLRFEDSDGSMTYSEKSYSPLFTYEEILDLAVNLNYSLRWHFYTLLATNMMYFLISYDVVFDSAIQDETIVILAKVFCNAVLLVDSFITVFRRCSKTAKSKVAYRKIDTAMVITQLLTFLILPLQFLKSFVIGDSLVINLMFLTIYIVRYYKLLFYILLMHSIPSEMTITNLYRKNFVVVGVLIHSFACIWMCLGCLDGPEVCEKKFDGPETYWNVGLHYHMCKMGRNYNKTGIDVLKPFENYVVCLYYVTGGLTRVGFGGSSLRNYPEDLICIFTMLLYVFAIYGLHCAELTSYVIHRKTLEFDMLRRRQAMSDDLRSTKFIGHKQRRRVLKYYEEFWERDRAVKSSSMLETIPRSLFVDTQTEIFWTFMKKCYFLHGTTPAFERALASKIRIEILNRSDVLYELNAISENVYYIARGNIEILSSEDGNSTIVTLGKGTCLGQMHLFQRTITRYKVVIASYSVVYILNKRDFWTKVHRYRKVKEAAKIHENFKAIMKKVRFQKVHKKEVDVATIFRKWKCVVAKKILTSFKEEIKCSQQKWVKLGTSEHEDPSKLYTYSKIHSQKTYDEVFLNTSFPWIFQQSSQLISVWNFITTATVIYVSILYPFQAAFRDDFRIMTVHVVSAVYGLDIVIQLFTAIDTKLDVIRKVELIATTRLESPKFALDLISAFPVYLISIFYELQGVQRRVAYISNMNKLLKLYKVDDIFKKLEKNTRIDVTFVRSVRNVLYLTYFGYISGCIFYIITCFSSVECDVTSWITALYRLITKKMKPSMDDVFVDPRDYPAMFSYTNMFAVLSGTTTAFMVNLTEIGVVIIVALCGVVITMNLFAGYAASVTLTNSAAVEFMEFLNTVKEYMSSTGMTEDLRHRVVRYLENIWTVNKGRLVKDLYRDCPEQLYNKTQVVRYKGFLLQMELFKYTRSELQNAVASRCTEIYLPPNEYVIYAGETSSNWYVIIHGYCGIMEGVAVQKVLNPGSTINTMEIFAGLPSLMTIRTQTHCKFLKFAVEHVQFLTVMYPTFVNQILSCIDHATIDRIFSRIVEGRAASKVAKAEGRAASCFVFPTHRRHPLYIDYRKGFKHGKWKFLKFMMMRRTLLPNGRFYRNWEIFRAVSAFIVSLLAPSGFIHYAYLHYIHYLLYVFYAISIIDIYLKLHLCYYNDRGVLVTHPKFTAINYMSHSFALDAISAVPLSWLVLFLANTKDCKLGTILHFNVAIQMYRFPNAFASTKTRVYKRDSVIITMLKTVPYTLVIINILTCTLLCISGEEVELNGVTTLRRHPETWITAVGKIKHMDLEAPWLFYMLGAYVTTLTVIGISFNLFRPTNFMECIYFVACILIGYVVKMYNIVCVAHNRFNVAHKLTQHRNYMVHLSKYMKEEKLPKELQHRIIEHYEHVWRMTHAVTPRHIFSMLHIPLKLDVVSFLYRNTLRKVPLFEDANETFYRHFGMCLNEVYMKKGAIMIKLNDIVRKVYIIHTGEAVVFGPDGSVFDTLREGSMFGNLDDVEATRSMVTVYATSVVDLLVVETSEMYKIFANFEYICNRLQHHLLLENLSYVVGGKSDSASQHEVLEEYSTPKVVSRFRMFLMKLNASSYMIVCDVFTSILCCWLASYQVAFVTPFNFFYALYLLDLFHCTTLVWLVITPYYDNRDQLVVDTRETFKQNLKSWRFFVDVITIPPYDVIGFSFRNHTQIRKYIGLYRLLRIMNVYHGFDRSVHAFGAKIIVFRLIKMSIYIIMVVHLCACFWYHKACPMQKCRQYTWIVRGKENTCQVPYVCSIYLVMSVISTTGFQNRVPRAALLDMILCSALGILGQYLLGSIIGDIVALVRNSTMDLAEYNFELAIFNTYLENGIVSIPLMNSMKKYCISLWTIGNGRQIPTYLKAMPKYLLEDLKKFAYGEHIYENVFFENCHKDFLRLLIMKLKVEYFFAGDVICHQEDINDTMYFIHKGVVNVYSLTSSEELHVDELREMDSFGIIQGLFTNTPHTHTFKAASVCVILRLQYQDLEQLLTFYPASKFEIYSNMMLLFPGKPIPQKPRKMKKERSPIRSVEFLEDAAFPREFEDDV